MHQELFVYPPLAEISNCTTDFARQGLRTEREAIHLW